MVKGLSLSLVSKHGITFLRISDLLTQKIHLVQNTLHTYTVSTRKFDLKELREIVVGVWQCFFVDHELQIAITGRLCTWEQNALAFCFWWRSFVLFGQWSWSRTATTEDSTFTIKCPIMELSNIAIAEIPPSTITPSAVIILPIFCFAFVPPGFI